jgi:hypothetical protein
MDLVKHNFSVAYGMLSNPAKTLKEIRSEKALRALIYLLMIGAVTAFLTPLQIYLGYEDINGLHAGGQAEVLAMDVSTLYNLSIEWRPFLIEAFYVVVLTISTLYLHIIFKAAGGKGSVKDTFNMIAYGDAPGLLFGWIPYLATFSAVWAAVIQILVGSTVIHEISWTRATIIFAAILGIGIIDITLSPRI